MSGWGRRIDDLAGAVTHLLLDGVVRTTALADPPASLAARDAVLVELWELVGVVADVPQVAEVGPLSVYDVVHRPAQALHQALSELPRAVTFGEVELAAVEDKNAARLEPAWQRAARASLGLEAYVDGLGRLPDQHAWDVLRDLTDLAAALPYLDHDLSEAVLARLKSGEDLDIAYRMLTHSGHDALRLVTAEVRARVPAAEPPSRARAQLPQRGQQQVVPPSVQAFGRSCHAHLEATPPPRLPAPADPTAPASWPRP